MDLLSTTYKKSAELAGKSSKIALTFILVLTAFLGLNSLTGNEPNTSVTTSSSQLSSNQDMPATVETQTAPVVKAVKPVTTKIISNEDLALHMQLAVDQLETTVLMLQVLDQADGGPAPTE